MDTRQSMPMMGPPGYPHMPPMSSTGPTMTGDMKTQRRTRFACLFEARYETLGHSRRAPASDLSFSLPPSLSRTPCTDEPAAHDTYQKLPDASHASRWHPGWLWLGLHCLATRPPFAKKKRERARRGGGSQRRPGWDERLQEGGRNAEEHLTKLREEDRLPRPDIFTSKR